MTARALLEALLRLIFPERCAGCRQLGSLLCPECRAALTPYPGAMRRLPEALDDVRIAFVYAGPLRAAVHQLKFRKARRVAGPLGELMAAHLAARPLAADALVPIPLHPTRLAARGFNQAEALAAEVARRAGLSLISAGLARVRITEQQAQLNTRERQENVRDAFQWRGAEPPPPRILLVDDVLTTGATMAACAAALRRAGAERVYGLALARSRPDLQ